VQADEASKDRESLAFKSTESGERNEENHGHGDSVLGHTLAALLGKE